MGQEEVLDGEKDVETANTFAVASPPPKLNLRRLESIQRLLQYASLVVLFVFFALIAVSAFVLRDLDHKIESRRREIIDKDNELIAKNDELIAKGNELNEKQDRIDTESTKLYNLQKESEALLKAFASLPAEQKKAVEQKIENDLTQVGNSKQASAWIYIQIAGEKQRKRAADIARQLKDKGFIVPAIENVGDKAPEISEFRTCGKKDDSTTKQDLKELAALLKSLKVPLGESSFLRNCGKANSRQYELWFGKEF